MGEQTKIATREELLAPRTRRYKILDPLPISGLVLRAQSLTEAEGTAYERAVYRLDKSGKEVVDIGKASTAGLRLLVLCLVDENGNRIFSDADISLLSAWDRADAESAYDQCAAHVGLRKQDIEALAKNFAATRADS
jgi:hypothetical protein